MIMNYDAEEILKNELKELPDHKVELYEETFRKFSKYPFEYQSL